MALDELERVYIRVRSWGGLMLRSWRSITTGSSGKQRRQVSCNGILVVSASMLVMLQPELGIAEKIFSEEALTARLWAMWAATLSRITHGRHANMVACVVCQAINTGSKVRPPTGHHHRITLQQDLRECERHSRSYRSAGNDVLLWKTR
jgi:hypothetical protein